MIRFFLKNPVWIVAFVAIAFATFYWGVIATERYVSRAHVVLQSPEISSTNLNVSSLLSGTSGSGDLLLLKDHLESVDMLKKLQEKLDLRAHYAQPSIDWVARLDSGDLPIEKFYDYMQGMIKITFDDYSSLLKVEVQAYTPEMAKSITELLLAAGEQHMNEMGQRLAQEQVDFIDQQAEKLEGRLFEARNTMLEFQNEHGLIAPTQTVEAIFSTVSRLRAELALLEARTKSQRSFQSMNSSEITRLRNEAKALTEQIDIEQNKLARKNGESLNRIAAEYETLEMRAEFALELYSNALTALETTRVEASRKLKQISVLEFPTLPEFPTRPERVYNITVFAIFAIVIAGIFHLIVSVIRDHRD